MYNLEFQGRIPDGTFINTVFEKALLYSSLKISQPKPLPEREIHTPLIVIHPKLLIYKSKTK